VRSLHLLYDKTSAVAGAIDSGILTTGGFDELIVNAGVTVAAAAAGPTFREYGDDGASIYAVVIGGAVGQSKIVWGPAPSGAATVFGLGPVPRRMQVLATAGAGGTVRLVVWGVRREARIA